jgi:hypothetical protein
MKKSLHRKLLINWRTGNLFFNAITYQIFVILFRYYIICNLYLYICQFFHLFDCLFDMFNKLFNDLIFSLK